MFVRPSVTDKRRWTFNVQPSTLNVRIKAKITSSEGIAPDFHLAAAPAGDFAHGRIPIA
jgi:hypothetical protein